MLDFFFINNIISSSSLLSIEECTADAKYWYCWHRKLARRCPWMCVFRSSSTNSGTTFCITTRVFHSCKVLPKHWSVPGLDSDECFQICQSTSNTKERKYICFLAFPFPEQIWAESFLARNKAKVLAEAVLYKLILESFHMQKWC